MQTNVISKLVLFCPYRLAKNHMWSLSTSIHKLKLISSLICWVLTYLACLMSPFHHADVTTFLFPQQSCMCLSSWCHQYMVILHVSVSNIAYPFFYLYLYANICHLLSRKSFLSDLPINSNHIYILATLFNLYMSRFSSA
jgi:hypothetical protein